jgi:hypothetical protein
VGHYESPHYEHGHYEPQRVLTLMTDPLYFGLHTIGVDVFDPIGNQQSEATPEVNVFLNTRPTPPRTPAFVSQEEGGGPIRFSFTQSRELING